MAKNQQILGIFETMHKNGLVPATQVLRQRAETARLTKELLELRRFRNVSENALATLLEPAGREAQGACGAPAGPGAEFTVPTGLPSQLLARRPDVIAADSACSWPMT